MHFQKDNFWTQMNDGTLATNYFGHVLIANIIDPEKDASIQLSVLVGQN